ncbi:MULTISPECIES: TetR/AcrR family transcriptional regulator [Streptomyces]|uniref:TetR/AcrR family transcriptional regulator n=1 Tax=Streptomyces TaxID=1883 RepID=UPI001FF7DFDB|nr:TetR/AcrR family transcriptional regulator [Streptomyces sp. XM4011]MCK1816728.1 TetR/AcrR family transcriptional regulator [Streptomyces sp. XM4011]
MPTDDVATPPLTLRERRRAAATREILDAARRQVTEKGPEGLSLRGIARDLRMSVQSLYHYFPSRDALITGLITATYDDLADAVRAAIDTAPDGDAVTRVLAGTEGYRRWAITHPEEFQLLYGTPLRNYAAPPDGPTTQAMRRISAIFHEELFGGFTPEQLAAADTARLSPELGSHLDAMADGTLPPPATSLLLSLWGHMHGLVVLEVFGHTTFIGAAHQAELFRMSMRHMLEDAHRRIAGPAG